MTLSFRDRDWPGDAAISVTPEGQVTWCDDPLGQLPAGADPTALVAGALVAIAYEAAAVVVSSTDGPVEVMGAGLVATCVRRALGSRTSITSQQPDAIVDATGDPHAIRSALGRVKELGTIVLAGEPGERVLDADLYSTVHRRGLVLVGALPAFHHLDLTAGPGLDESELDFCQSVLADDMGQPLQPDALWFRTAT